MLSQLSLNPVAKDGKIPSFACFLEAAERLKAAVNEVSEAARAEAGLDPSDTHKNLLLAASSLSQAGRNFYFLNSNGGVSEVSAV